MKSEILEVSVKLQIQKPINVVFEALVNPDQMSNYFISESTGRMESGKLLTWKFPEFDEKFPVQVLNVRANEFISFNWDHEDQELLVKMDLKKIDENSTLVSIVEHGMKNDAEGIKWLKSNTEGWSNFLCCLKAFVEYNVNLRKGAFDFMRKK